MKRPCNCVRKTERALTLSEIRLYAKKESLTEKKDIILYELDSKIHYDFKECWEKAGSIGKPIEYIPFV